MLTKNRELDLMIRDYRRRCIHMSDDVAFCAQFGNQSQLSGVIRSRYILSNGLDLVFTDVY